MSDRMRLALGQMRELTEENMRFAKQLGIEDVQINHLGGGPLPGDKR